jgi:beta-mannosidase
MGTLYWQLNDCWPVASWSSIDYYGNWKALHYVARDVFSPIALSISKNNTENYSIWIMSDKKQQITDTLFINSYNLNGVKTKETKKINVNLKNFGSHKIINNYQNNRQDEFIIAHLKKQKNSTKTIFTSKVKDIKFLKPTYNLDWSKNQITISVDKPAFQVYFELQGIKFESNYLTLLPNFEYTINFTGNLSNRENLLIWSLYDLNK